MMLDVHSRGIGLHNRTYERCLSYLPEFGFLAVAIEAPGHGRSSPVARRADFTTRVDLIRRAVDALGIRRAVVAGHSMGGRSAACFTALNPRRVLAALFIDAALGENWDNALIKRLGSEVAVVRGLVDGIADTAGETRNITLPERLAYCRVLSGPGRLDAPLLTVPDGYHSWMLASPRTFAATMAGIFAGGTAMPRSAAACLDPDALVLRWTEFPPRMLPPRPDETVLDWRIEGLNRTDRRGSATAAGRAVDWAARSRR